jgi:hypothetical protein
LKQNNPAYIQMPSFCWSFLPYHLWLYFHTASTLKWSISLHRGPVGTPWSGGGPFTGDFERNVRFCLIKRPCLVETREDM